MERTIRYSKKREAILTAIRSTHCHPSAEWVYQKLKPEHPDLSLGTVYRNLIFFQQRGDIQSVGVVKGQERFDAVTTPHSHFVCNSCGAVSDLHEIQLDAGLEQLGAVMMGGDMVEVKAVITLDFLVLQPVTEPVITGASVKPMDMKKLQELPGIVGYIVQPEDSLWTIAKKFHTTVGNIITTNELADDQVKEGQRLLLVKEIVQG